MTNPNKLIIGAVVVLGVLYFYDRNKKMKAAAELAAILEAERKAEIERLNEANLAIRARADAIKASSKNEQGKINRV